LRRISCLGHFVVGFRNDQGLYQGFLGGLDRPEAAAPVRRPWAITEHNLDLYAAFELLAGVDPAAGLSMCATTKVLL
jgi:hypothetical protein